MGLFASVADTPPTCTHQPRRISEKKKTRGTSVGPQWIIVLSYVGLQLRRDLENERQVECTRAKLAPFAGGPRLMGKSCHIRPGFGHGQRLARDLCSVPRIHLSHPRSLASSTCDRSVPCLACSTADTGLYCRWLSCASES